MGSYDLHFSSGAQMSLAAELCVQVPDQTALGGCTNGFLFTFTAGDRWWFLGRGGPAPEYPTERSPSCIGKAGQGLSSKDSTDSFARSSCRH